MIADPTLAQTARTIGASPAQVALAWVLNRDGVIAIPKAGTVAHVQDNRGAADLLLSPDDLAALDTAFAPPRTRRPLEML